MLLGIRFAAIRLVEDEMRLILGILQDIEAEVTRLGD